MDVSILGYADNLVIFRTHSKPDTAKQINHENFPSVIFLAYSFQFFGIIQIIGFVTDTTTIRSMISYYNKKRNSFKTDNTPPIETSEPSSVKKKPFTEVELAVYVTTA
uniref:Uncharacterized protein n=1 Tax=Glossina brevipalpis TaxID=37001 RepID=A0A1A9WFB9_9MUSC